MIIVDPYRCSYCGGCVSVCPVQALILAETQLVVDNSCTECGDCLTACAVGALRLQFDPVSKPLPIRRAYDVVVVGAGPGGSTAAQAAARAGLSVLLIEKRQEIGSPVRCAEGVGHEQLAQFIAPNQRWISAEVSQIEITARAEGLEQTIRASGGHGYILERRVFDRVLAERAAQAGAEVHVKTAATGLLSEAGQICGIKIGRGDFFGGAGEIEVQAKIVIAADGVESQVGRWAGLDVQMPLRDTMVCVQYLLAGVDIDPTCTYYTIEHAMAPGGYIWIFPKGQGKANVGLGVQADIWQESAARLASNGMARQASVLKFLDRFIESNPRLAQGSPVTLIVGNVPVAMPPAQMVTNGLMLIGDAARQVDPLTGGGIINAMTAGHLAAQVVLEAITAGDTSAAFLRRYTERWNRDRGRRMQRNYRLRDKFAPTQRTDERFVHAFAMAAS